MLKKLIISLMMLSVSNLICMEEGNSGKKNKFEESLALELSTKKQKPELFNKWLYLPNEIWTQIIYFLIQDCKDTKEMCRRLKYFALTCKNFKNLTEGQGINSWNRYISEYIVRQVPNLLESLLINSGDSLSKLLKKTISNKEMKFDEVALNGCINPNLLKTLVDAQKIFLSAKNQAGNTFLHYCAAYKCDIALKELLSLEGINVNAQSDNGGTSLIAAVANENIYGVQQLLAHTNIDISLKNTLSWTALSHAKDLELSEIVKLIEDYITKNNK